MTTDNNNQAGRNNNQRMGKLDAQQDELGYQHTLVSFYFKSLLPPIERGPIPVFFTLEYVCVLFSEQMPREEFYRANVC